MKNKKSKSNRNKGKNTPKKQPQPVAVAKKEVVTPKATQPKAQNTVHTQKVFIFGKKNYLFMFIGLAVIALGFILMAGGGSDDPNVFNEAIFSTRRIHIAPMVVILGFAIEVYAILLNPNSDS
jgi:hypothetical protein